MWYNIGMKLLTTKEADDIFSKLIRARDGNQCVMCGRTENLTCSHFWGRGHSSTRYDPENCDTLCWMPCHIRVEKEKQGAYRDFKLKQLGARKYVALQRRSVMVVPREEAIKKFMIAIKYNENILGPI